MQVVDFPHLAPSICLVCESAIQGIRYADTARDFQPGPVTHLDGRKYLCEHCVRDAAHALGVFDEERAQFVGLCTELQAAVADRDDRIEAFQAIEDAIYKLTAKPKAKKAKKAKDAEDDKDAEDEVA